MTPVKGIAVALLPLIFAVLAAFGITLSEDVKKTIQDNVEVIILALGALGTVVPGIAKAVKDLIDSKKEEPPE